MRLRIISVNDIYTLERLPRLASLIRAHQLPGRDLTISIIAGDFVGPSLLSSLDAGRGMVDCLNALGIGYAILGNHEDDISATELHKRVEEFRGVWLSTNVDFDPKMPRDAVIELGDRKLGLVAVVLDDLAEYRSAPFGGAPLRAAQADAVAAAARLRARGCDLVIALTHQSIAADRLLAQTGAFPLIVGGHEHVPFVEQVAGCWIVKAGQNGDAAIISDIDREITVTRVSVDGYPEDPDLRARVDHHMEKVREISDATLVRVANGQVLSSVGTRVRQTSMGHLLCTRIANAMHADLAVLNGGAIRANREYRDRFTYGDLETEVPFDNEVVVVAMPGRVLRAAIAASRALAPVESGGFLQTCAELDAIADASSYRVALVRNLFEGMDHNQPLIDFARDRPDAIPPANTGRDIKLVLAESFALELWKKLGGIDHVDTNHDGIADEAEILAALERVGEHAPSHVIAKLIARTLPTPSA